jgi:hypothetical protein
MKQAYGQNHNATSRKQHINAYIINPEVEGITTKAEHKNEIAVIILIMAHITLETREGLDKTVG